MTDYLRAEKFTLYLPKKGGDKLLRDAKFRKDEFGEIAVYRAFWNDVNNDMEHRDNLKKYENWGEFGYLHNPLQKFRFRLAYRQVSKIHAASD